MECSICKSRAASGSCDECGTSTCDDCGVRCQRCKTDICPRHVYVTPGGRSLCKECMARRSEAAATRKKKHREKVSGAMKGVIEESAAARSPKAEALSFEALMDGATEPAQKKSKDDRPDKKPKEFSAKEPKEQAPEAPPKELEVDPNRPILTTSMKSHRSGWPFIPAGLFLLGVSYFVYTRVPSLRIVVVGGIAVIAVFLLARAYLIHKARSQAAPEKADARRLER